jgi:hypothetical protein
MRCSLRLHLHLRHPDAPRPPPDPWEVARAHVVARLRTAAPPGRDAPRPEPPPADPPPPALRWAVDAALEGYAALTSDRPGRPDDDSPSTRSAVSRTGLYRLAAPVDLVVTGPGATVEVRRVAWAHGDGVADDVEALAAALVLRVPALSWVRLGLLDRTVGERVLQSDEVAAVGRELATGVLACVDGGDPEPGTWCTTCPFPASCPAVRHLPAPVP